MEGTTLGSFISHRRQKLEISQRELAKKVRVSNSTISRIENDDNITPDNDTLRRIAEVLRCDYNYLLALNKQIDDQPEIRMIQRAAKNMTPERLQDMMTILRTSFREEFNQAGGDEEA